LGWFSLARCLWTERHRRVGEVRMHSANVRGAALARVAGVHEGAAVQHEIDPAERQLDGVLVVVGVPAAAACRRPRYHLHRR